MDNQPQQVRLTTLIYVYCICNLFILGSYRACTWSTQTRGNSSCDMFTNITSTTLQEHQVTQQLQQTELTTKPTDTAHETKAKQTDLLDQGVATHSLTTFSVN